MKNAMYISRVKGLQSQISYLKGHADIRYMKPAEGKLREWQLGLVREAAEFLESISELEIKPFLYGGNLIGYVRHNGFIPWDDDIDFAMMRNDYERLREYCRLYMYTKEEFFGQKRTDKEISDKMRKYYWSNSGGDEFNIYRPFEDGSKIVIDFFVLDYYAENYPFDELMELAGKVREKLNDFIFDSKAKKEYFSQVLKENEQNVAKESNHIYFGIDNMEIMHKFHRGNWIPREVVFPLKRILYEGVYFWVPNDAEEFLKYEYENIWAFPDDVGIGQHMHNIQMVYE